MSLFSPVSGTLYAGGGLPEIEIKGVASAGSLTVTGAPATRYLVTDYVYRALVSRKLAGYL